MANGSGLPTKRGQRYDISGIPLPTVGGSLGPSAPAAAPVVVQFPGQLQPPENAPEFILSWSVIAPAGATTPLFVLDANGNVTNGAAMYVPDNSRARIAGVIIEGETILGTPILQFFIADRIGTARLRGWSGLNLPGRGGIVALAVEPFTVAPSNSFFGAWVTNNDAGPHYASMIMQGWLY